MPNRPPEEAPTGGRALATRVVIPLYERLSGRRPWTQFRRLRELQWRSAAELEARAIAKLAPLLAHAYAHVPYYRDLFTRAELYPDDIRTVSDLSRLPLTGKVELRRNFPARVVADNLPPRRRFRAHTSGSTGFPFEFYSDRGGSDAWLGSYLLFREWAGVAVGDATVYIAGAAHLSSNLAASSPMIRAGRRVALGERVVRLSGAELGAGELRAHLGRLSAGPAYVVWGWPSYLVRVAGDLLERRIDLPIYPRVVVAYAETLGAADAAIIGRAFRCRVVNHYSSFEALHLAQTCPDNPALLHVNSERAIVRVVGEDGRAAPPGRAGRVVITDLANWVMPFVNYDIGDRARAGGPCPCGRGLPTLARLEGRMGETIRTPGGKRVSSGTLSDVVEATRQALACVWEYQAVQTAADAVTLRVVPTPRFTPRFASRLEANLGEFLGAGMRVEVVAVDRIAVEPSGKRLIIKSELAPSPG